jgi:phage terminase large subunit-like protein
VTPELHSALVLLSSLVLDNGKRWGEAAQPWQWLDAMAILDERGTPYHFVTRPRGGSKTTDVAAVLVAVMLLQMPDSARLYVLAADRDQGRLLLNAMRGLVTRTAHLRGTLEFSANRVVEPGGDIVLEILASNLSSSWGLIPDFVVLDELAQWPEARQSQELYESVRTSLVKRRARFVVITTAGQPGHFAYSAREHARDDKLWRLHEVPGPAPWNDPDALEEQRRALPESSYRRLYLNEWVETDDRLATFEELLALVTHDGTGMPLRGTRYFFGVDLGVTDDRTAVAIVHIEDASNKEQVFPERHVVVDRVATWMGTPTHPVQLADVRDWLVGEASRYSDVRIVLDSWQSVGMTQELQERGIAAEALHVTAPFKSQVAQEVIRGIRDRSLELPNDGELLRELARVRVRESSGGLLRIDHDPGEHDDRVMAIGLAMITALSSARMPGPRFRVLR